MENHKDLPSGSQRWAQGVDKDRETIKHLEAVVKRLTASLGLDYRNPDRGINAGDAPSVQNAMPMKLDSLQDMNVYNKQDGDYIMWSSLKNKWVVGRPPASGSGTAATNLFKYPNPALGPWHPDPWTSGEQDGNSFYRVGEPSYVTLESGKIVLLTGDLNASGFIFPLNNSGLEVGKTYVFSFDIEAALNGAVTELVGDLSAGQTIFEYNWQISNNTPPYPGTMTNGAERMEIAFTVSSLDDLNGSSYLANHVILRPFVGYGTVSKYSKFMVNETTALTTTFLEAGHWAVGDDRIVDLLALGAAPGATYQIDAQPHVATTDTSTDYWLHIKSDGVNLGYVELGRMSRATTVTVPLGATSLTLESPLGYWDNIHIYSPTPPFFTGDTPDDEIYTYSWAGEPNNSASIRTPK